MARTLDVDVLVIGGGRSGVAAAEEAAGRGSSVALLESVPQRAHPRHPGIRFLDGATAVGWYDGIVTAIDDSVSWSIRAGSVIAATGTYERVPAVRGADRPGVIGARRAIDLVAKHGVVPGERPLLVGEPEDLAEALAALDGAGARPIGSVRTSALRRVLGRRRVTGAVVADDGRARRLSVDLIVFGDRTPNLDLVLAAGASVEQREGVLRPILDDAGRTTVPMLSVVGSATGSATGAGVAGVAARPAARALVCFCEDVHADEIRAQVSAGYGDPELVKRRTGALTGPCQGKYCLQAFAHTLAEASGTDDLTAVLPLPTARPPLRPVRLGDLVTTDGAQDT